MIYIKKEQIKNLWNKKGYLLAIDGKYKDSIKCFDKALEIIENDEIALLNKANALSKLGINKEAIDCIENY